ncbi:hypothetical protein ACFX11_015377 [Malus domestica]
MSRTRKSNRNKKPTTLEIVLDSSDTITDTDTDSDSSDLNSPISELFRQNVSKHRSCWRHVFASSIVQKKRITLGDIKEVKKSSMCLLECPPRFTRHERSKRFGKKEEVKELMRPHKVAERAVSRKKEKLDSGDFMRYFENLWNSFSEDKRTSFAYLDCLWFSLYLQQNIHKELKRDIKTKVLKWIKNKCIFSKKYVIVPIVCWSHWNLLILCHFGESLQSETQRPCMLLLDSLQGADPGRYEEYIRKFVLDIFMEEGRPEKKDLIYRIPLLVPEVPQQRDDFECGNFVLYYINLFMEGAPENFSTEGYPYFMKKDWFSPKGLDYFCQKLYTSAT